MNRFLIILLIAINSQDALGQLIFDFSETDTGGVIVSASGAGTATGNRKSNNWRILDFDNDFLNDAIGTTKRINADSVSGTLSRPGGPSASINRFSVNRSKKSNDDISWKTKKKMKFKRGDSYSFSLVAVFDKVSLSYLDLFEGIYTDLGGGSRDEIFGTTKVAVSSVPEPAFMGLIVGGAGVLGYVLIRRRKSRKQARVET